MSDLTRLHTMDLFSRFFQENREKFLTFAYSYLRDRAEAEDVLMESMITLWENRDRWEEGSNLHALLLTIIKNKSLNILEHKQIRLRAEEDINSHSQRELNLRISTLKACEPEQIFDNEIHAQRALSIMLNIKWKSNYFESIDPVEARRILDEELFGMESVKQRIIETVIQINRTHTLPAYGILLVGPAGTGKSQIAYLVAKILKMPWTTLDMSSINDAEQLTGSSRIYSNAKPGIIMESFNMAGESNLVFIINELDKATSSNGNANPADVLLTLLDNLGFTDNYMECLIPTSGVYPIATANDKDKISAPLLSRFAVIDIPDYTREEKKTIFLKYSLPKVLKRIGLHEDECLVLDDGLEAVLDYCKDTTGIRDLEQAAEHLAAHALYLIEVEHATSISYNADMVKSLFR